MTRKTLTLDVMLDTCLGRQVYRGSASAKKIIAASWIDYHDIVNNPWGYQRPFDAKRSAKAADYANETDDAFWPECILAIRDDGDEQEPDEAVEFSFKPESKDGRYGELHVDYKTDGKMEIGDLDEPYRRAFSQVDCQHRLGRMADSNKPVTFCIIPGINRRDEAITFWTINARQKGISTSLVDTIVLLTNPDAPLAVRLARSLYIDPDSPYAGRVDTGGRGRPSAEMLVRLRGFKNMLQVLLPIRVADTVDDNFAHGFARNFWKVVKTLWPAEWEDKFGYKLQASPGQRGLAQFGSHIFRQLAPVQDLGESSIRKFFPGGGSKMNWKSTGPLSTAIGKGGQKQVFDRLVKIYGLPS
jgi:DGQHR domain-containing protein